MKYLVLLLIFNYIYSENSSEFKYSDIQKGESALFDGVLINEAKFKDYLETEEELARYKKKYLNAIQQISNLQATAITKEKIISEKNLQIEDLKIITNTQSERVAYWQEVYSRESKTRKFRKAINTAENIGYFTLGAAIMAAGLLGGRYIVINSSQNELGSYSQQGLYSSPRLNLTFPLVQIGGRF